MASTNNRSHSLSEKNNVYVELSSTAKADTTVDEEIKTELVWPFIAYVIFLHLSGFYGLHLVFTSSKLATIIFAFILYVVSGMGITAGAHRLWSHRAYKAKWQLRLLLVFLNSMCLQGHILTWARDHRTHHKYSDTNADPYNASRGLFFSHIGWLTRRKHPDVLEKGRGIDMSDLNADPILRLQKKYYWTFMIIFCYVIPTVIPVYFWDESWTDSFFLSSGLRTILSLHATFSVNSIAHYFGYKPYDRNIRPADNQFIALIAIGEGWHNYHHTFPWDYRASEFGNYGLNITNAFIDFFAWIGWAYDLKTVSPNVIKKRIHRTGNDNHALWGWNDENITEEDKEATHIIYNNKFNDNGF